MLILNLWQRQTVAQIEDYNILFQCTDLSHPSQQPLEGLGVLVLPPALHEALHLKLLDDHGEMCVWA